MQNEWFVGQDFEADRVKSLAVGMNDQLWSVFEDYFIDGKAIKPTGKEKKLYFPMAKSRLPFELAKVRDGDESAAMNFINEWGLLGRAALLEHKAYPGEDTLLFVWGHAATVSNVLILVEALKDGREMSVKSAVDTMVRYFAIREGWRERPSWLYMNKTKIIHSFFPGKLEGPRELAHTIIAESISKNLVGLSPLVVFDPTSPESASESMLYQLRFTMRFQALIQCVYWHLAMITTKNGTVLRCEDCGEFFEQNHKAQRFCPPTAEQLENRVRGQSRCAMRSRKRKERAK